MALIPAQPSGPLPVVVVDALLATGAHIDRRPDQHTAQAAAADSERAEAPPLTFTIALAADPSWEELLGLR